MDEHPAPEQTHLAAAPAPCTPQQHRVVPRMLPGSPLLCLQGAGGTQVLLVWGGPRLRGRGSRSQAKILVVLERAGGDASPSAEPCAFGCGEGR